LTVNKRFNYKR